METVQVQVIETLPNVADISERKTDTLLAKRMANLRPAWKAGDIPNPKGRPSIGMSVLEWVNGLQEETRGKLRGIALNEGNPVNKVIAARLLYHASSMTTVKGVPIAGADFDRLLDRTLGKAIQQVHSIVANVSATIGPTGIDYQRLSDDELAEAQSAMDVLERLAKASEERRVAK